MDNIHYNTMNLLGKDLKIVYHPTSKLFTLIDCLGNEVATNSDGRKLIKFAWSFSPKSVNQDFNLRLVED
jgi:hypothetical protein